jgi:hypothetical protein
MTAMKLFSSCGAHFALACATCALVATTAHAQPTSGGVLAVDDGTFETAIGPPGTELIAWMNVLSPPPEACEGAELRLDAVRIRWPDDDGELREDVQPGDKARAFVYLDADGDGVPATGARLLAEVPDVAVPDDPAAGFAEYPLAEPVAVEGCADVIVAFVNTGMRRDDVFLNGPAALDETDPQGRSWVSVPGDELALPLDLSAQRLMRTSESAPADGNFLIRAVVSAAVTAADGGERTRFVLGAPAPNPVR